MRTFDECLARAVASIKPAVEGLEEEALVSLPSGDAIGRGYFSPTEDDELVGWFARLLTVRAGLWEVIDDATAVTNGDYDLVPGRETWRCFLAGYAAACLVVRLDRLVVEQVATHKLVQRKLNEGSAERRIPRKQFTTIFRSLTDPRAALRLLRAMRYLDRHRDVVEGMREDPVVGSLVSELRELEASLDPSKRRYLKLFGAFEAHATRRRGASARQRTVEMTLEGSGRVASELRVRKEKRVLAELDRIRALLVPGDVLVTRHEGALTNLFLPGFWPHAALYLGTSAERRALGLDDGTLGGMPIDDDCAVLEALKDGVLFRPLESTLAVDAVAVIRPRLPGDQIAQALERAAVHEGKLYNFDFDFFRSDRLVCTEVIYRALDGLGPIRFELVERSGRPTLTAEDLLDAALLRGHFDVIAVLGVPESEERLWVGAESRRALEQSYRSSAG